MKNPELTQLQLATLAASLADGTPSERVALAREIWKESAPAVYVRRSLDRQIALGAKRTHFIPLADFMREMMPTTPESDRFARWKLFRDWQRAVGNDRDTYAEDELKTGSVHSYMDLVTEFMEWEKCCKSEAQKSKASKAARTRWANAPEGDRREGKAGGKTKQVKKKSGT